MRSVILLVTGILFLSCGKDSPPKPPEAALLVFPERNSECTTGIDLNDVTSQVEFRWQEARFTDTYELRVTNLNTGSTQTITTTALSAVRPLEKGALFRWEIRTRNEQTEDIVSSESWLFYNAGSQDSYAPFPAEIIFPVSGASVVPDINNEITLQWSGSDVDNDLAGYEIYLDTSNPPTTLAASPSVSLNSTRIVVQRNTVYYWKIISRDRENNTSDTGVYSFRVL
ncbi:hypothetical protein [Lentiprolixibacter aurantiacus]|uniref:Fibronectin type-III domain-containing protein n=1 Tax=Lentiprolixibacter aurantiacus TaxID=2993939 RepID=A0AAE3MK19_9FLAO|nr:hypothetical protein [Lentiprolixibacter aurantiacus]MCX2718864.1 hypothetical protein [Lentiprolixibacter aurantiacus]